MTCSLNLTYLPLILSIDTSKVVQGGIHMGVLLVKLIVQTMQAHFTIT